MSSEVRKKIKCIPFWKNSHKFWISVLGVSSESPSSRSRADKDWSVPILPGVWPRHPPSPSKQPPYPCNTPTCLCSRHLAFANPCLESVSPLHGALASPPSGTVLTLHTCTQNIHKHTCMHTTQPPHILCTQKSMYQWSEFCSHF